MTEMRRQFDPVFNMVLFSTDFVKSYNSTEPYKVGKSKLRQETCLALYIHIFVNERYAKTK